MEPTTAKKTSTRKAASRSRTPPKEFALARLARRDHGTYELSQKMARAGYTGNEIQAVLDFLRARGYLDDPKFAREIASSRAEHKHWGPLRIRRRLLELGIEESHIEKALAAAFPNGEEGAASQALNLFLGSRGLSKRRTRDRAYRHLVSRGFSGEVAYRLVSRANFEDTEKLDDKDSL